MPKTKMIKGEALKAFKKALEHRQKALKRTKEQWESEGIKGNVVTL